MASSTRTLLQIPEELLEIIVRACDDISALKSLRMTHPRFSHLRLVQQIIFAKKTIDLNILSSREGELDLGPFQKYISHVVLRSVNISKLDNEDAQQMARDAFRDGYAQHVLCNALRSLRHISNVTIQSPQVPEADEHTPNGNVWAEFALRCIDDARLQLDTLAIDVRTSRQEGQIGDGWNYRPLFDFPIFSLSSCKKLSYSVSRDEVQDPGDDFNGAISAGKVVAGFVETCSSTLENLTVADRGLILWPPERKLAEMPMLKSIDIHDAYLDRMGFGAWISACRSLSQLRLVRTTLWAGDDKSRLQTDWKPILDAIAGHTNKISVIFEEVNIRVDDGIDVDLRMHTGNGLDGTEYCKPKALQNVVRYLAGVSSWEQVETTSSAD